MKTFRFNKLVRDKIPAEIQRDGGKVFSRKLSKNEFLAELVKKISEESTEISSSLTKPEAVKELVDLYEVVSAIQKWFKIDYSQIKIARDRKNQTRGAFAKRIFVDRVQVPNDYPWLSHYRKNSDRYQEITHPTPGLKKELQYFKKKYLSASAKSTIL